MMEAAAGPMCRHKELLLVPSADTPVLSSTCMSPCCCPTPAPLLCFAGAAEGRKSEADISMAGPVQASRNGAGIDQGPRQPAARPAQSNITTPTAATAPAASGHEEDASVPTDEEIIMQHLSGLDLGPGF